VILKPGERYLMASVASTIVCVLSFQVYAGPYRTILSWEPLGYEVVFSPKASSLSLHKALRKDIMPWEDADKCEHFTPRLWGLDWGISILDDLKKRH